MTAEEKREKLNQIAKDTLNETLSKLYKNNRVLVVRPTGFGKSYMLAGLTSSKLNTGELRFKKCLYVYPTKVIKQSVVEDYGPKSTDDRKDMLQNTTFISYMKITKMVEQLNKGNSVVLESRELYNNIYDISSDGDWTNTKGKVLKQTIKNKQGDNSFRSWIKEFDLIMLDECHRACADGFLAAWDLIGSIITKSYDNINLDNGETPVKLVGVTATPDRLDGRNIREIFGKNNQISRLTLKDCIQAGLLSRFDYVYAIGDKNKFYESAIEELSERRNRDNNQGLFDYEKDELRKALDKLSNIPNIIRESIKPEHTNGYDYYRFVVFFNDAKHLSREQLTIKNWFENAFPDKKVEVHNILSKTNSVDIEIQDVDLLEELDKQVKSNQRLGCVDVILCIDKLNMGYHVENITGVMLLRNTNSEVIYNQQIGRCFSVRSNNKPIIFDIIDKTRLGTIIDKENKTEVAKGEKYDLPSKLDSTCVDTNNKAKEIISLLNNMRLQKYNAKEQIIRFLSEDRHAPNEVISQMTKISLAEINKILEA